MNVVFLVDAFPAISETFILNQITGLKDLGHEVFIVSGARPSERDFHNDIHKYDLLDKTYYHNDKPANYFARLFRAVLLILYFGYRNPRAVFNSLNVFRYGREALALTYLYKVMLFIAIGRIDVVHCQYGTNGNLAALLKEMGLCFKIITTFHGYDIRRGIENNGRMYRPLFQKGDLFLSISEYNRRHLLAFGADPQKIIHHPVGIDLQRYSLKPRGTAGAPETVHIITVSRLVEEKGLSYGFKAIARLVHQDGIRNIHYTIIGDGPLRNALAAETDRLGLKNYVHFMGNEIQAGVIRALHASDIFFLPSVAEALPVSLMEAQAAGLPVVATDVGSVREVIAPERSGFLVESRNIEAMAMKLKILIEDPSAWPAMGEAGRAHVDAHFNIRILNKQLESLYQECTAHGQRTTGDGCHPDVKQGNKIRTRA